MHRRNKRILWLLNHKTLMEFEVKLLIELGFEVFTPKIIPTLAEFRSGHVDFRYDSTLTVPAGVLKRLNEFNFYENVWPADIVALVNRYFGSTFFIPIGIQVREVLDKFEGQLLLRCFGLDQPRTYATTLRCMDNGCPSKMAAAGSRFWFAQGYQELAEVEPPLLAERALFLPIGVPPSFFKTQNTFRGGNPRLLFVCPNCVTSPYYARIYKDFKRDFGDFPHLIMGTQDVPVDDPSVLGFVSNDELIRIYQECALLYYHSKEPRHVHYSPIEAVIKGMPLIYYADSLLGRMTSDVVHGRCHTLDETRSCIERILNGDREYIAALQADQRKLIDHFSYEHCKGIWETNLADSGYLAAISPEKPLAILWREIKRTFLRPFAHGLSHLRNKAPLPPPPNHLWRRRPTGTPDSLLSDGVDFTGPEYPWFIEDISGLSDPEPGGRWSTESKIILLFAEPLPKSFQLLIQGGAHRSNLKAPIKVRIGKERQIFSFPHEPGGDHVTKLSFSLRKPSRLIEITVPRPVTPPGDNRRISIALRHVKILSCPPLETQNTKAPT
jgi:hypothetical protein